MQGHPRLFESTSHQRSKVPSFCSSFSGALVHHFKIDLSLSDGRTSSPWRLLPELSMVKLTVLITEAKMLPPIGD